MSPRPPPFACLAFAASLAAAPAYSACIPNERLDQRYEELFQQAGRSFSADQALPVPEYPCDPNAPAKLRALGALIQQAEYIRLGRAPQDELRAYAKMIEYVAGELRVDAKAAEAVYLNRAHRRGEEGYRPGADEKAVRAALQGSVVASKLDAIQSELTRDTRSPETVADAAVFAGSAGGSRKDPPPLVAPAPARADAASVPPPAPLPDPGVEPARPAEFGDAGAALLAAAAVLPLPQAMTRAAQEELYRQSRFQLAAERERSTATLLDSLQASERSRRREGSSQEAWQAEADAFIRTAFIGYRADEKKLLDAFARAAQAGDPKARQAAEAALQGFYASHPELGAYYEALAAQQRLNQAALVSGQAPEGTTFTAASLGWPDLPADAKIRRTVVSGREGLLVETPQSGPVRSRFESFDGELQVQRIVNERGEDEEISVSGSAVQIKNLSTRIEARGRLDAEGRMEMTEAYFSGTKHQPLYDDTGRLAGIALGASEDGAIDLQPLVAAGRLKPGEAKRLALFLPDPSKRQRFTVPPRLEIAADGKKRLFHEVASGSNTETSTTYFNEGSVVNQKRLKMRDGVESERISVHRSYFLKPDGTPDWKEKEIYETKFLGTYDPERDFGQGAGVLYSKEVWNVPQQKYEEKVFQEPKHANAWDMVTKDIGWILANKHGFKELGAVIGFVANRGKDVGYGVSAAAGSVIAAGTRAPDQIVYNEVTKFQMPLLANREGAALELMAQLRSKLGDEYPNFYALWKEKYQRQLLKDASDPATAARVNQPNFEVGDEELGRFLISGGGGAGFGGAGQEFSARAAASQSKLGAVGNWTAATGVYAGDFVMQSLGFHGIGALGNATKTAAKAANATKLVRAADVGLRGAQHAQSAYFKTLMIHHGIGLGHAISHEDREATYASLAQAAALGIMPGGNKKREAKVSPFELNLRQTARELGTTSPLAKLAAGVPAAVQGLSKALRERKERAAVPFLPAPPPAVVAIPAAPANGPPAAQAAAPAAPAPAASAPVAPASAASAAAPATPASAAPAAPAPAAPAQAAATAQKFERYVVAEAGFSYQGLKRQGASEKSLKGFLENYIREKKVTSAEANELRVLYGFEKVGAARAEASTAAPEASSVLSSILDRPLPPLPPLKPSGPRPEGHLVMDANGKSVPLQVTFARRPKMSEATFLAADPASGQGLAVKTAEYVGLEGKPPKEALRDLQHEYEILRQAQAAVKSGGFPENFAVAEPVGLGVMEPGLSRSIYGHGEPVPVLLMLRAKGQTLQSWLDAGKPLNQADFQGFVEGVRTLNAKGILHGDLNMGNIIIAQNGARQTFTLIDFGAAKSAAEIGPARLADARAQDLGEVARISEYFAAEARSSSRSRKEETRELLRDSFNSAPQSYRLELAARQRPKVEVEGVLSTEGSGAVVLDAHLNGSLVAVKTYKSPVEARIRNQGEKGAWATDIQYFHNEIEMARAMADALPGRAPAVYGEVDIGGMGHPSWAMQKVRGKTPDSMTREEFGTYVTPEALRQVADGVRLLAQKGLGGRDSPSPMILTEPQLINGVPKKTGDVVFIDPGALTRNPKQWMSPEAVAASLAYDKLAMEHPNATREWLLAQSKRMAAESVSLPAEVGPPAAPSAGPSSWWERVQQLVRPRLEYSRAVPVSISLPPGGMDIPLASGRLTLALGARAAAFGHTVWVERISGSGEVRVTYQNEQGRIQAIPPIKAGQQIQLGREQLGPANVSTKHLTIEATAGGVRLHESSTNGTRIIEAPSALVGKLKAARAAANVQYQQTRDPLPPMRPQRLHGQTVSYTIPKEGLLAVRLSGGEYVRVIRLAGKGEWLVLYGNELKYMNSGESLHLGREPTGPGKKMEVAEGPALASRNHMTLEFGREGALKVAEHSRNGSEVSLALRVTSAVEGRQAGVLGRIYAVDTPRGGSEILRVDLARDAELSQLFEKIAKTPARAEEALLRVTYETLRREIPYDLARADQLAQHNRGTLLLGPASLEGRAGVCRHQALAAAAVLEGLKQAGRLRGDVYYVVGDGHAWVEYVPNNRISYILDIAQGNFRDARGAQFSGGSGQKRSYSEFQFDAAGSLQNELPVAP